MIHLKEIDLSEVEKQKQKVISIREELKKEEDKLKDSLVALNLDYYGTSPGDYYKSIHKSYNTEDGYAVAIKEGSISIQKRLQDNLTMSWIDTFDPFTEFNIYRSHFEYDSGRFIESISAKADIVKRHENKIQRFAEILQEEQIFNPFTEYHKFYSFTDFWT